ncbi:hypothetical protein Vadar_015268 [Vaccinium darrowii]|uniref:Uncharacterized protein n=1 Tax=Vaccinium darrowii TaxID=229202 RepID=A0ACB7XHT6_9ERIC|nr:hypothetical protein Vadar_015268 [Vaccinium darrowii]
MQLFVNELWHTSQPVLVVARHLNSFVFRFYSEEDLEHAISRGPWLIRGGLLVLDYRHFYDHLKMIRVRRFHLWVQLHKLPFEAFTREAGGIMGLALRGDVTVDVDDVFPRQFRYLRVCVSITPDSMLVQGFFLDIPGGEPRRIECRYKRVSKVCRACGRIGHTYPQCDLSRAEAAGHVDAMINGLFERFGFVVHTDETTPLYINRIRAFARSNARRNTHMWAVRGESMAHAHAAPVYQIRRQENTYVAQRFDIEEGEMVDVATQMESIEAQQEELPLMVDYEQFLENYEDAWNWGLQRPLSGFFQQGDFVVLPTSMADHAVNMDGTTRETVEVEVSLQNSSMGPENVCTLERVVSELLRIRDETLPEVEEMDCRWSKWEAVVRQFGINAGRCCCIEETEGLVEPNLSRTNFVFTLNKMAVVETNDFGNKSVEEWVMGLANLGLGDSNSLGRPTYNRPINRPLIIREPVENANGLSSSLEAGLGRDANDDSRGKRPVEESDEESDSLLLGLLRRSKKGVF